MNNHAKAVANIREDQMVQEDDEKIAGPKEAIGGAEINGEVGSTNGVAVEEDEIEDECRAEAVFQYTVTSFSKFLKDSQISPPCMVRGLPWKIMAMLRTSNTTDKPNASTKTLGFFLQCNADSECSSWSCSATAELKALKVNREQEPHVRKISHLFFNKENDWGFSNYMTIVDLLDPEKGFYNEKDDTITLEVHVVADAPHGINWDSKKHTGYVGLRNQGATCYMNSLLQTLYFTNKLRTAIYLMPTESDDPNKSVPLALQRVYYELQTNDKPVGTKKLTRSFGWETVDSFMQHDVQELSRVLLDNVEEKMKGTCVDGTISELFSGSMLSYIKCKTVNYMSSKTETFYDIQLNVKAKKSVVESFDEYITVESLDGVNKYDAGEHGLQEAEKGVVFLKFPPVLHLQLMRYQYDAVQDCNVKINDRYEFPERLNLDKYLQKAEKTPATYVLHAVLVHSGDNHGGHYVVYIQPQADGKWCRFDDDVVSRCTKKEALDNNFGGHDEEMNLRACTSAYMLVYIRESYLNVILPVCESDIPPGLVDRLNKEKDVEAQRRKERSEAHLYMSVHVILEDDFSNYQGYDLFDADRTQCRTFRVKKLSPLSELLGTLADTMGYPIHKIRPWPFAARNNQTLRPMVLDVENELMRTIADIADQDNPWLIFLETVSPESPQKSLSSFDKDTDVLLFFKMYDPRTKTISYCGHSYLSITQRVGEILPVLCQRGNLPPDTELLLFEEVKPNLVERIVDFNHTLEKTLEELMDGDIIIFQKDDPDLDSYDLPTALDYFRDLYYRIDVTFCDKQQSNGPEFTLLLNQKMNYDQVAKVVASHLDTDPYKLQFFKSHGYRDIPGNPIRCTYEGTLKDLVLLFKQKAPRKIFYQHLKIRIDELDNKKQFRVMYVTDQVKEVKELVLYPNKNGCVRDLLDEAKQFVQFSKDSTGKLRFVEISGCKIFSIPDEDTMLEFMHLESGNKTFRAEEVPRDQLNLPSDDTLVPVAHFYKELFSTFGVPFLLRVKHGESFQTVKARMQKILDDVPEKEFDKFRFSIVTMGFVEYIDENDAFTIDVQKFRGRTDGGKIWIGLEHVNRTPKRTRYNYQEKAIKIHN